MATLEPEQEDLLASLCVASRSVDRHHRQEFLAVRMMSGSFIKHPGLGGSLADFVWSDIELLERYGLLHVTRVRRSGHMQFVVTPEGFEHWERMQRARNGPVERVEDEVRRLLAQRPTSGPYRAAFDKWAQAEANLWSAQEDPGQLTTIGHLCREAMQHFADEFAHEHDHDSSEEIAKTVSRVRAGLDQIRARLPGALGAFLDALLDYWGTVSDLVQRLEHGAGKEGEPITWEDARLLVFQTANVMFELDRAAQRASRR